MSIMAKYSSMVVEMDNIRRGGVHYNEKLYDEARFSLQFVEYPVKGEAARNVITRNYKEVRRISGKE
tara:strand:- start:294 stop:494 length:201 start_codon:yes stop_codon:yes gene_type:complete